MVKLTESEKEKEGNDLLEELSKKAVIASRILFNSRSTDKEIRDAQSAMLLLNHAQALVNVDPRTARRLYASAKRGI